MASKSLSILDESLPSAFIARKMCLRVELFAMAAIEEKQQILTALNKEIANIVGNIHSIDDKVGVITRARNKRVVIFNERIKNLLCKLDELHQNLETQLLQNTANNKLTMQDSIDRQCLTALIANTDNQDQFEQIAKSSLEKSTLLRNIAAAESGRAKLEARYAQEIEPLQAELDKFMAKKSELDKAGEKEAAELNTLYHNWEESVAEERGVDFATEINKAYTRGVTATEAELLPLWTVGAKVVNRMLETSKSGHKDFLIIEAGDAAAHLDNVIEAASLYLDGFPQKYRRYDTEHFKAMYGVTPTLATKHKDCEPFVKVLNWHGCVHNFHGHNPKLIPFVDSKFYNILTPMLRKISQPYSS
jgi:hypothetical protein